MPVLHLTALQIRRARFGIHLSMNVGIQQKFFKKKVTVTLNIIDPFRQQQNKNFTYGSNFNLESYSTTNTRNYRLVLSYTFKKKGKHRAGQRC